MLETQLCAGGTGIFEDLLMVRLNRDCVREDNSVRERLVMTRVGSFTLGDRDNGEITMDKNRVIIRHSRYRCRTQCFRSTNSVKHSQLLNIHLGHAP